MEQSPVVLTALKSALDLSRWISDHHPTSFPRKANNWLPVALYAIAIEHREAILLLVGNGARTSAFALARSVFEAHVRACWAQHCATGAMLEHALRTGITPTFDAMVRQLNKLPETAGVFGKSKGLVWESLSDFAHGGMRQVIRWQGVEGVAPQHRDEEVVELLWMVNTYGVMACLGVATVAGLPIEPYAAKSSELGREHLAWRKAFKQPGSA